VSSPNCADTEHAGAPYRVDTHGEQMRTVRQYAPWADTRRCQRTVVNMDDDAVDLPLAFARSLLRKALWKRGPHRNGSTIPIMVTSAPMTMNRDAIPMAESGSAR